MYTRDFTLRRPQNYWSTKVRTNTLIDLSFVLYFCAPFLKSIFSTICTAIGVEGIAGILASIFVYLPLLVVLFQNPPKAIRLDFICLWIGVVIFFGLTAVVHPEYMDRYLHSEYGVLAYVLLPIEGLYAYWFVRLIDDPTRILRNMKIAGWIMYVYFAYQIYAATQRGYWVGITFSSARAEMSYSVSFGYNVMLFLLPFFYDALLHKKKSDIFGTTIGLLMILTNGSRGPILFIAIFLLLMGLIYLGRNRNKWVIFVIAIVVFMLVFIFYDTLLMGLASLLSSANISSRSIIMILNGTIATDNGRIVIWDTALQMIREKPFGYGAMGSQHQIFKIISTGYPHSIILEMFIDFGVIVGSLFLIFLLRNALSMLFKKKNREWVGVFLLYFCVACQLFISLCFWSSTAFWACIAVAVNCFEDRQRKRQSKPIYTDVELGSAISYKQE